MLEELLKKYPESPVAGKAKKLLKKVREYDEAIRRREEKKGR